MTDVNRLFVALRPVCITVHEHSVRVSHVLSVDPDATVIDELMRAQCSALVSLCNVLAEHVDDAAAPLEFASCAEYGLTAVLPMLTMRYEPNSLTSIELTTQCRTQALAAVELLLRPVATLAPTTCLDVLWIVTGFVATPVTTNDAASLRALRATAVRCAHALLSAAARGASGDDVGALLTVPIDTRRRTAFLLSQLLAVAGDTRDREVCEAAIEGARALLQCVGAQRNSDETRMVREQFLAWCFPGVASAATRAVLGDYKVGHRLRCGAVALLTDAISMLLTNERTSDLRPHSSSIDALRSLAAEVPIVAETAPAGDATADGQFVRRRSPEWYNETREHLNTMLQRMYTTIGAESDHWADGLVARVPWQLRQCMVALAELLLVECQSLLLESTTEALLDCVVVSVHHEQPLVADAASAARDRLRNVRADVASLGAIQRSLQRQATALPRIFHAARVNDAALLAALRLVRGYVDLLPHDANVLLILRECVAPMVQVMVELLEVDMQSAVMSELRPTAAALAALELERDDARAAVMPSADDGIEPFPHCRYRRLHDERVADAALALCRLLGARTAASAQLHAVVEQLVALLQDVRCVSRSGALQLAVATVEGAYSAAVAEPTRVRRAATMLVESIVECVDSADAALLVVGAQAFETLLRCDAESRRAVGTESDRSDALDAYVMRTLHSLLDMLAHEQAAVQQSARAALQRIARLCRCADVRELVRLNADYVIDCACRRIRHEPELLPSTARILLSVMRHSDSPTQLSLLVDAVESIAARLVRCDTAAASTALELLAEFAGALCRVARANAADPMPPRLVRVTAPLAALLPRAIRSRSAAARVAALALTSRLVGALKVAHDRAGNTETNADGGGGAKLLPTVHDVWASLVPRLDDSELAVSLAALHVLATLADVAGSFLRTRVADNVVPTLRTALRSYGTRAPVSLHSGQHKRTLLALDCLSVIARRCELPPATLASIGALAHDVAQSYDWRDVPDVAARLKSLQTDASALAAHAAR